MSITYKPADPINPNHPAHLAAKEREMRRKVEAEYRSIDSISPIDINTPPPFTTPTPIVKEVPKGYRVGWKDVAIALLVLTVIFETLWIMLDLGAL